LKLDIAFDKSLKKFKLSAAWLSRQSSVSEKIISQFRNGHQRIYTETLEKLVEALPIEAKLYFFDLLAEDNIEAKLTESLRDKNIDWNLLISNANPQDMEKILLAMADRWSQMKSEKKDKKDKKAETEDLAISA
jgi:hypothetical protein